MSHSSYIHVASIGKAHGIKGGMSIISKLHPAEIIFTQTLYINNQGSMTPFPVDRYEQHHVKTVCFSSTAPDRNGAEQLTGATLYCKRHELFKAHPEQIFDDLCTGYQVFSSDNKLIGKIDYVTIIHSIPMATVIGNDQTYNLPLNITEINHDNERLTLAYTPHDH